MKIDLVSKNYNKQDLFFNLVKDNKKKEINKVVWYTLKVVKHKEANITNLVCVYSQLDVFPLNSLKTLSVHLLQTHIWQSEHISNYLLIIAGPTKRIIHVLRLLNEMCVWNRYAVKNWSNLMLNKCIIPLCKAYFTR